MLNLSQVSLRAWAALDSHLEYVAAALSKMKEHEMDVCDQTSHHMRCMRLVQVEPWKTFLKAGFYLITRNMSVSPPFFSCSNQTSSLM